MSLFMQVKSIWLKFKKNEKNRKMALLYNNIKNEYKNDDTVKLGDKKRFEKEQIDVKEPFSVINCQFTSYG